MALKKGVDQMLRNGFKIWLQKQGLVFKNDQKFFWKNRFRFIRRCSEKLIWKKSKNSLVLFEKMVQENDWKNSLKKIALKNGLQNGSKTVFKNWLKSGLQNVLKNSFKNDFNEKPMQKGF